MSASTSVINSGEQAWNQYLDITRVVRTKYPHSHTDTHVSMALQRLGEAILSRYQLNPRKHVVERKWNLKLTFPPNTTPLSTTRDMVNLKIVEWEEEIPIQQAGHDVWTDGRTAAWRPQKSLQETLSLPYRDLKAIADMTPETAVSIFTRIHTVVKKELDRLKADDPASAKASEISRAVNYLAASIIHKYGAELVSNVQLTQSQKLYVASIDLYSINSMLDAKVYKWSIRSALNISTDNLFSKIFWLQEAWWGQAKSLANVESALR